MYVVTYKQRSKEVFYLPVKTSNLHHHQLLSACPPQTACPQHWWRKHRPHHTRHLATGILKISLCRTQFDYRNKQASPVKFTYLAAHQLLVTNELSRMSPTHEAHIKSFSLGWHRHRPTDKTPHTVQKRTVQLRGRDWQRESERARERERGREREREGDVDSKRPQKNRLGLTYD